MKRIIDIVDKGCFFRMDMEGGAVKIEWVVGGARIVKGNWILFYGIYPEHYGDWHDVVVSNLKEMRGALSFNDQEGRLIYLVEIEKFDRDEAETFKEWLKFKRKYMTVEQIDSLVEERLENSEIFIGDVNVS